MGFKQTPRKALAALCKGSMLLVSLSGTAAFAHEFCQSKPLSGLALRETAPLASVDASINGQPVHLIIDTGGSFGMMEASTAERLGLTIKDTQRHFGKILGGARVRQTTQADHLSTGTITHDPIDFVIVPPNAIGAGGDATLGADFLSAYDIELNFSDRKAMFFPHGDCAGHLYGRAHATDFLPDKNLHVVVQAFLDGRVLTAGIDTGAEHTSMNLATAIQIFGKQIENTLHKSYSGVSVNGAAPMQDFTSSFQSLQLGDVNIDRPPIQIFDGPSLSANMPQVLVGLDILRRLDIFVAYGEKKLYIGKHNDD